MTEFNQEIGQLLFENEIIRPIKNEAHGVNDITREDKSHLNFKLQQILRCAVCLELRRSAIYQCKYGHLICAGCFGDVLSESKMQNEIATCPNCQSTISKESCTRNVAVEKTISELPMTCPYCCLPIFPESFKNHTKNVCEKRPAACCNILIGCSWQGFHSQKLKHQEECKQLSASGSQILLSLTAMDQESKKETGVYEQIFELLSVESFSHFDLQFKQSSSEEKNGTYETSKFSAFENHWLVHGCFKEGSSKFNYQLILKSNFNRSNSLNLHYLLVKGPYSEMDIKPNLCQFKFDDKSSESPYTNLTLWNPAESLKNIFSAKRVNFRIFLFLNK